jgi:hypothetical protein
MADYDWDGVENVVCLCNPVRVGISTRGPSPRVASLTLGFVMEHRWCSFRNSMFCGFCGINMTLGKISAMETGVSYHV